MNRLAALLSLLRTVLLSLTVLPSVLLVGCPRPKPPPAIVPADPTAALAAAQMVPGEPRQARFNVHVTTPDNDASTVGVLTLMPPDRLRLEIQTPLRTPMLLVVSDGTEVAVWRPRDRTVLRTPDAPAALGELTGGAVAMADAVALLSGRLPGLPARVIAADTEGIAVALETPVPVSAILSPTGSLRSFEIHDDGGALQARLDVTPDATGLPATLRVELPGPAWVLDLTMRGWAPVAPPDAAFMLSTPAGATEVDLVEALKELGAEEE